MQDRFIHWLLSPVPVLLSYLAFSVSAQAVLTPVVRAGPGSTALEPLCSGRVLDKFNAALEYLERVPEANRIIGRLQNSATEYRVEIVVRPTADAEPHFDALHNTVRWDPRSAMEWRGAFNSHHTRSPALLLLHELGHAYHKEVDRRQFFRLTTSAAKEARWTNLEEERTILEVENPVARALGESERFFHEASAFSNVQLYAAVAPNSTQPSPERDTFLPMPGTKSAQKESLSPPVVAAFAPISNQSAPEQDTFSPVPQTEPRQKEILLRQAIATVATNLTQQTAEPGTFLPVPRGNARQNEELLHQSIERALERSKP